MRVNGKWIVPSSLYLFNCGLTLIKTTRTNWNMLNDFSKYSPVVACTSYIGLWSLETFKDKRGSLSLGRFVKADKTTVLNKIFN